MPFLLSAVVVVTAYLIRRRLEEPPAFTEAVPAQRKATPLRDTFSHHKSAVLRVAACAMVNTVNMVFTTFALSYATAGMGIEKSVMLWVPVASNTLGLLAIPLLARLSDRVGRKPVFIAGAVLAGVSMFPYLLMIHEQNIVGIFLVGVLMHGGFYSMANGIWPSFYAEMFPTSVRVTGMALGTQIGFAVSGGVAPVAATALAGEHLTGWFGPAAFTLGMCLIVVVAALTAKETSKLSLAEIDNVQSAQ